jgi:hypothetical protein
VGLRLLFAPEAQQFPLAQIVTFLLQDRHPLLELCQFLRESCEGAGHLRPGGQRLGTLNHGIEAGEAGFVVLVLLLGSHAVLHRGANPCGRWCGRGRLL